MIPKGLCQCGCGNQTRKIERNNASKNHVRGEYYKFIKGHYPKGELSPNWRRGYRIVEEHVVLAKKALGKKLPKGTEVHHHTETQLVVCPDRAYHKLLHQRQKAFESCGNVHWRKCKFCKKYDDPEAMAENKFKDSKQSSYHHRECEAKYARDRRR